MLKQCSKCKIEKNSSEFYNNNRSKDHLTYRCKMCILSVNKNWYIKRMNSGLKWVRYRAAYAIQPKGKYAYLKGHAKQRGHDMSLTFDEYKILLDQKCVYCGFELPRKGIGLDRINNSLGYINNNVVPCCTECNVARSDHFTQDEMKILGAAIAQIKIIRQKVQCADSDL